MANNNSVPDAVQVVWNILGGDEGVRRLRNRELVIRPPGQPPFMKTWRRYILDVELPKDFRALKRALKEAHIGQASNYRNQLMDEQSFKKMISVVGKLTTVVDLVIISVEELGLGEGSTLEQVSTKGLAYGLELCAPWSIPLVRTLYQDQPHGEWLRVAMEPIRCSDGKERIFSLAHDCERLFLHSGLGSDFRQHDRFMFVKPVDFQP